MRAELPRSKVVCEKHVVDDTGQLVRSGGYCFRPTKPPFHPAVELAEVVPGAVQASSTQAQCGRRSVLHLARPRLEDLPSAGPASRGTVPTMTQTRKHCESAIRPGRLPSEWYMR